MINNQPPRTVVIIVNYNNLEDTKLCLDSIKKSDSQVLTVVVDNASEEPGIDDIYYTEPDVSLIKNTRNLGFAQGNNAGIKWAMENTACKYFLILNNDTTIQPDTIQILESHFQKHSDVGCATPQILYANDPKIVWYGGGDIRWELGTGRVWTGSETGKKENSPREVGFASGCAMMVKREVFSNIGGFDPRFFMYEEDVELSIRISNAGYKIIYIPDAIVYHRGQGSRRKKHEPFLELKSPHNPNLCFYMYHLTCNRLLNAYKHARGVNLIKFLFYFPLYNLYQIFLYLKHRKFGVTKSMLSGVMHFIDIRNDHHSNYFYELSNSQ